ncbi:hypothetical protein ACFL2V_00150 [Pseudomonadota bacterium]
MALSIRPVKCTIAVFLLFILPRVCLAGDYFFTLYNGKYTDDRLGDVLLSKQVDQLDAYLAVVALSHVFPLENAKHQWEIEAQLGKHYRGQHHSELNLLAIYRWQKTPWDHILNTSFALGDGLSYASEIPPLELASTTNIGASRLLNYILVEMTVAPPHVKNWSIVARVHHRSGVYGLFNDVEGGSNVIAMGIKFRYY